MKEIELLKIIFKDSPDILEPLNKIDKEIERLNKELEFEKLKNKEVREYIEKEKEKLLLGRNDFTCEMVYSDEVVLANELLEILDKENT